MLPKMRRHRPKILFILKKRDPGKPGDWGYSHGGDMSSGLKNSVVFMVNMLEYLGADAKMVSVVDNNEIDREVTAYKPTHVIIEAYWVVPSKFEVLMKLHPNISWTVRNHSKSEFLANEGIAFGWTLGYLRSGVKVGCNSIEAATDMRTLAHTEGIDTNLVTYLPNFYPFQEDLPERHREREGVVDVGCFGAIRPLKNVMVQALAAIAFADKEGIKLRFHINATRVEGKGEPILKNLRELFDGLSNHDLVEHEWMEHIDFLRLLNHMDIVTQVSFSETFNIVAADAVSQNVPIVVSEEVAWAPTSSYANPNKSTSITKRMSDIWNEIRTMRVWRLARQRSHLRDWNEKAKRAWVEVFNIRT